MRKDETYFVATGYIVVNYDLLSAEQTFYVYRLVYTGIIYIASYG